MVPDALELEIETRAFGELSVWVLKRSTTTLLTAKGSLCGDDKQLKRLSAHALSEMRQKPPFPTSTSL